MVTVLGTAAKSYDSRGLKMQQKVESVARLWYKARRSSYIFCVFCSIERGVDKEAVNLNCVICILCKETTTTHTYRHVRRGALQDKSSDNALPGRLMGYVEA